MDYQILDWDSKYFGFKTAKILPQRLEESALIKVLEQMREEHVKLAYWPAIEPVDFNTMALGGKLVDKKVTFIAGLKSIIDDHSIPITKVKAYQSGMPEEDLLELAVQAGQFSRFATDPNFPQEKFIAMYHEWMRKCIKREMADDILVIPENNTLIGMVTVQDQNGVGDIGLIAVNEAYRGRHYGEMLVRAAQRWFLDHDIFTGQVVTQRDNRAACSLYEKCGYHIKSMDYLYHFWL